jgi:unsaturated rhamnogalacturonyl hydrolase
MRRHRLYIGVIVMLLWCGTRVLGQTNDVIDDVATDLGNALIRISKDSGDNVKPNRRTYEQGVVWLGMMRLWYQTGDARYYNYVKRKVDQLVDKDGNIATYVHEEYNLDNDLPGRVLLDLYDVTLDARYYKAALRVRKQLRDQPLNGLYMAMPFRAQYAALFHEDSVFDDIAHQFAVIERHTRDPKTGLLYHGRDESGREKLAMGWYGMALVDALDYFPAGHPGRDTLISILRRYAEAVRLIQDKSSGASASAMFVYTLARGVTKKYLPVGFAAAVKSEYSGIRKNFINDPKGDGVVLLAAVAIDDLDTLSAKGEKAVVLDYYFNNERRKDITGASVRYHYTWEDRANSGFSLWGNLFRRYKAPIDSLAEAPTAENLKKAAVYIIVDPDDAREVPDPHYLMPKDIGVIEDWVKAGGVLVLMSNDSANAEFEHFNMLAAAFGIHFNYDDYHKVIGNRYEMGAFTFPDKDSIFASAHKVYIKELSTLTLSPPARAYFSDSGHVIMAVARVGKGTVFAVGDPWFYNEYTDGRKLPPEYENYDAALDLAIWMMRQAYEQKK